MDFASAELLPTSHSHLENNISRVSAGNKYKILLLTCEYKIHISELLCNVMF